MRFKPFKARRFNFGGGINRATAPLGTNEPFLAYADGVMVSMPPALRILNTDLLVSSTASAVDIRQIYKQNGDARLFKRTATAAYLDSVTLTGIPNASGRYSSATFRGKLLIATEGSSPYSVDIETTSPTPVSLNDGSTKFAPKGGLIAGWKNRVWITGNNETLVNPDYVIPLCVVGVPHTGKGIIVYPSTLNFGTVQKFVETPPRTVFIQNCGTQSVKITGISAKGSDYKIVQTPQLPFTLATGQTMSFQVTFCPETKGVREGTVIISTNMAKEVDCTEWTSSGATITLTSTTLTSGEYATGYYAHLVYSGGTKDVPITGNTETTITVDQNLSGLSGSSIEIRHKPTHTITLTGTGSTRLMYPSPTFADFGQWISYATGGSVKQELVLTFTNPYNDTVTFPITSNWAITSDTGATFSITDYKINDGSWVGSAPSDSLTLNAGKSLVVKLRAQVATGYSGPLTGTLTVKTTEEAKPNRLYFSAANDETDWDPSTDWIDFQDKKGEAGEVQALVPYSDMLWVFTESTAYCITGNSPESFRRQEIPLVAGVGIANPKAWTICGGILYFASKNAIWAAAGTSIQKISTPLGDLVEKWTTPSSFRMASYANNVVFYESVKGFYIFSEQRGWTLDTAKAGLVLAMCNQDGGNLTGTILYSTSMGIYGFQQTSTTATKTINIETPWDAFGSLGVVKRVLKVCIYGEDIANLTSVTVYADDGSSSAGKANTAYYTTAGTNQRASGYIEFLFDPSVIGTQFWFQMTGTMTSKSLLYGMEIYYQVITDVASVV